MKFTLFGYEVEIEVAKPTLTDLILIAALVADIAVMLTHRH